MGHACARGRTSGSVSQKTRPPTRPSPAAARAKRRIYFFAAEMALRSLRTPSSASSFESTRCGRKRIGVGAGGEAHHPVLEAGREGAVARLLVGQVERDEEAAAADVGHHAGELDGELAEARLQVLADDAGVLDQVLLGDDLEVLPAADHVDEVAAPRRVDAGGDLEDVVGDVVDAVVGGEAADLRLLAEGEQVGLDAHLLPAPHRAGQSDARLDLVEDQQELVLVGERAQALEELGAEVVVAALALDRLDDQRRDVVGIGGAGGADLALDLLLRGGDPLDDGLGHREGEARAGECAASRTSGSTGSCAGPRCSSSRACSRSGRGRHS